MIREDDVLLILHKDPWFRPSESEKKKKILDEDGNEIEVSVSYYHDITDVGQILIRVSNHGTWLRTWLKRATDPSQSLQNLSVVFSNEPVSSEMITEPVKHINKNGEVDFRYLYFVVEQYAYKMENISKNDFLTFIKKLKSLGSDNVFKDPFKKKPSKKASRTVLMPNDKDGTPIPSSTNPVHPRQTVVANNPDFEVDAKGNVIKDSRLRDSTMLEMVIRRMVAEEILKLQENNRRYRMSYL